MLSERCLLVLCLCFCYSAAFQLLEARKMVCIRTVSSISSYSCPSNTDPCLLYFTAQPPTDLPCNPHIPIASTSTLLNLECIVHAPRLDADNPDTNFTLEWVWLASIPGSKRESINVVSSPLEGIHVENSHLEYFYMESTLIMGTYVKSTLSFDLENTQLSNIPGSYWCRVLAKNMDNYSYFIAGYSNSATKLLSNAEYLERHPLLPPCVSEAAFHQPAFECVKNYTTVSPTSSVSTVHVGSTGLVLIPGGALIAIVVTGGVLIVVVLALAVIVVCSCRILNERKQSGEYSIIMCHG